MKKGENMRLVRSGITRDTEAVTHMRPDDFSSSRYGGIQQKSDGGEDPVVIMRSKETDPLRWKVVYGFSRVFFRSLAEAVEFCNSRGFRLVKEQLESREKISRDL